MNQEKEVPSKPNKKGKSSLLRKLLKWSGYLFIGFVLLIASLILALRTPAVQQWITNKATQYVSELTGAECSIDRLYLTFSGNLWLEGVFLSDLNGDTLFYCSSLETGLRIRPLFDREIRVRKFDWRGLEANVVTDSLGVNNFDFLIEAFSGEESESPEDDPSQPFDVFLPEVSFSDIKFSVSDRQSGMDMDLSLKRLLLSPLQLSTLFKSIDQESISISGLKVNMLLYDAAGQLEDSVPPTNETEVEGLTVFPNLSLGQFSLDDLSFNLIDRRLDSELAVKVDRHLISKLLFSPEESSSGLPKIAIGEVLTEGLIVHFAEASTLADDLVEPQPLEEEIEFDFQWPGIELETGKISFIDSDFHYFKKGVFALPGEFNPENIRITSEIFELEEILLGGDQASISGFHFQASEQSGLRLSKLGFDLSLANDGLQIRNIDLRTPHSLLDSEVLISFEQISQLVNEPGNLKIDARLRDLRIGPGDIDLFQPQLKSDPNLGPLLKYPIQLRSRFTGNLNQLNIAQFDLRMGSDSRLQLSGRLNQLLDFDRFSYSLPYVRLSVPEVDLSHLIALDSPFVAPEFILVSGTIEGNADLVRTGLDMEMPFGKLNLSGQFSEFGDQLAYDARLVIEGLDAAYYSDSLGPESIVGTIEIDGRGIDPRELQASFSGEFAHLQYQGVRYSPLSLEGSWGDKRGVLNVNLDGEFLAFEFMGSGSLDTTAYELAATMDITKFDAFSYGLFEDSTDFKSRVVIEASGNEGIFSGFLRIDSLIAFQVDGRYMLDSLEADVFFDPSTTFFDLRSAILRSNLSVNTSPDKVLDGLMAHIRSYSDPSMSDSLIIKGLEADFQLEIPETRFLKEVIAPDLEEMESIRAQVFYRESSRNILMELDAPFIHYAGIEVRELMLRADSNRDSLQFETGFSNLQSGGVDVQKTRLLGVFKDSTLWTTLDMTAEETQIALLHLKINMQMDNVQLHLRPEELIFNDENWSVDEKNLITYASNYLIIDDFNLRRQDNFFSLKSHPTGRGDFLGIEFSNLSLGGLLDLVNPVEDYADAILNGKIEVDNIFEQPELLVNVNAEDLVAMEIPLGNLMANVESRDMETFVLQVEFAGGDLDLMADGELNLSEPELPQYRGNVELNRLEFSMLERFTAGAIRNSKGKISGQFSSSGIGTDIEYTGFLRVDSVNFVVVETGTSFSIPAERIDFSQSDIVFTDFTIQDGRGNPTVISGVVDITNPINPGFGLHISSRNFRFLESTRADNDFVYGKAIADLDIIIEGDLSRPQMQLEADLKRGTEITMIVPESQVDIEEREGVVRIERRIDGEVVRDDEEDEISPPLFTGLDLQAVIRLDPSVIFRIILDERAGDQLEVAGRADLSFDMDREGRMSLSGIYELTRGFYEMRMYDIVRRRFELQPGSRLSWFGDPMEAEMAITAVYRIRTSALDLMADQLAGADQATRTQFRQELPFEVVMDISGELLRPVLQFSLDMPETARGAHGGNVYSRIQQLNTTESELNTQVFSLLVLNRFLPQGFASEESQLFDAGAMARSSASSLLSGQLNALSDRFVRGVDLDFDLESFTDYQTGRAEDRTQLNVRMRRSLVGDRLTLEVGGQIDLEGPEAADRQSATDILGDVNIEYSLTEDGSWRIRGFRRNQYEGVLEGQVIATGISLLFNRDFNTIAELFQNRRANQENDQ